MDARPLLRRLLEKRLSWLPLLVLVGVLLAFSAIFERLIVFALITAVSAVLSYTNARMRVPFDASPLTLGLLVIGHFFGPLGVIAYFLFAAFIPGTIAGNGLGPTSFVYIPLNIGLGVVFWMMHASPLVPWLAAFLIGYVLLVFVIDGMLLGSFGRSFFNAAGMLAASAVYLVFVWRLQMLLGFQ